MRRNAEASKPGDDERERYVERINLWKLLNDNWSSRAISEIVKRNRNE